jgi:hypothetical protein
VRPNVVQPAWSSHGRRARAGLFTFPSLPVPAAGGSTRHAKGAEDARGPCFSRHRAEPGTDRRRRGRPRDARRGCDDRGLGEAMPRALHDDDAGPSRRRTSSETASSSRCVAPSRHVSPRASRRSHFTGSSSRKGRFRCGSCGRSWSDASTYDDLCDRGAQVIRAPCGRRSRPLFTRQGRASTPSRSHPRRRSSSAPGR